MKRKDNQFFYSCFTKNGVQTTEAIERDMKRLLKLHLLAPELNSGRYK